MKTIGQHEIYEHLGGFLKTKGIELKDGSYARGIQKSCSLLTDAINLGQEGFERAKVGINKKLDQVRQVIHEKTAPTRPAKPPVIKSASDQVKDSMSKAATRKTRPVRKPKSRR